MQTERKAGELVALESLWKKSIYLCQINLYAPFWANSTNFQATMYLFQVVNIGSDRLMQI